MKLKEIDYKLLNYLYHNHNEPVSKIAKATKISRDKVEYRINKYQKSGLIKQFIPIINYSKLGYSKQILLLLKFETTNMAKEFAKELKKSKNCLSYGFIFEKFDLYINEIFKNQEDLTIFMTKIFEDKENIISEYLLIEPTFAELYPLKFLDNREKENYQLNKNEDKKIKIDETDLKILKILSKNGRIKLLDIALKLDMKSTTIFYRLKKLRENKIILGNRIQFSNEKLKYNYTIILINLKRTNNETKEKIKHFTRQSKNTNSLILNLHEPNAMIQFFYEKEQELRVEIKKLKKVFENEQIKIELMHINEEEYINSLPFIK
ncbi:MAG: winged helix-turn-helix transcriptional regulator [Nanoarchaeota archaeon]|nr:winged helix-turn-helix transcriptional regulator [Nanoarchaeota archaeon]